MKKVHKIIRSIMLIVIGALTYSFISEATAVYLSRPNGNIGGEILVIPMIAALIWLGWEIRDNIHQINKKR